MKTRKILAVILTIFTLAGVFNAPVLAAGNTGNSNGLLSLEISEPTQNFAFNSFRHDYLDVVVLPITRTITS